MAKSRAERDDRGNSEPTNHLPANPSGRDPSDETVESVQEAIRSAIRHDVLDTDHRERVVQSISKALFREKLPVVRQTERMRQTSFQGPLPPPDLLAGYEEVMPGLSERIVEMADQEQKFRHEIGRGNLANERQSLEDQGKLSYWGMLAAFILALMAILGGILITLLGGDARGMAVILVPLAILAAVFVTGKILEGKKGESSWRAKQEDESD